jgi:hypothetical protein
MFLSISGSGLRSAYELAHKHRLISDDLAKKSSEALSPAELSILALPIQLGDVG